MLAWLILTSAVAGLPGGVHIVEGARTDDFAIHGGEAFFVVHVDAPASSELRAVRLETGASRVLLRAEAIDSFAVDVDAGAVFASVVGKAPGVVLVPIDPAQTARVGRADIPGVRDVIVCGDRRYATSLIERTLTLHDLTTLTPGAQLEGPPTPPPSSPAAMIASLGVRPLWVACGQRTLTVADEEAIWVFDAARPTRVPLPRLYNESVRAALPLASGELLLWSQNALRVLDRAGQVRAAVGVDTAAVHIAHTPRGPRLLTSAASYALPGLSDRRALPGPRGHVLPLDDTRVLVLLSTGLRERAAAWAPSPSATPAPTTITTLREPAVIARHSSGKTFAVGDKHGRVVIFDRPRPGDRWRVRGVIDDHVGAVAGLGFLAAAHAGTTSDALVSVGNDGFVHVYAAPAYERVRSIVVDARGDRDDVTFAAHLGLVAVTGAETVSIVDVDTGSVRTLGPLPQENFGSLSAPAFSADGTRLAFVDDARRARVYALGDGREDLRFAGQHSAVYYDARGRLVRLTTDGAIIDGAAAPIALDHTDPDNVEVDGATGEVWLSSWSGWFGVLGRAPRQAPWHVADLVLDGGNVVTIGPDEQVLSWPRSGSGTARPVFGVRRTRVEAIAFVGDDVAVAFEGARVRVVAAQAPPRALRAARCTVAGVEGLIDLAPERLTTRTSGAETLLVGATRSGEVTWNLASGALRCPKHDASLNSYTAAVAGFTPDGRSVVIAPGEGALLHGASRKKLGKPNEEASRVEAAVVSGTVLVYVDDGGTHAVSLESGATLGHTRAADLAALPGGRVLLGRWAIADTAANGEDPQLALATWQPGAGAPKVLTREHAWTNNLLASPDGASFLHIVGDELWLRSTTTGAVRAVVDAAYLEAVAFSPDSRRFAVARPGELAVYTVEGARVWAVDPR